MELGDKPELRPHSAVLVVGGDEAKNVVVAEHHRLGSIGVEPDRTIESDSKTYLVDVALALPRLLVARGKDLDGDVLPAPPSPPHLNKRYLG